MQKSSIIVLLIIFVAFWLGIIIYLGGNPPALPAVENTSAGEENVTQNITKVDGGLRAMPDTSQYRRIAFEEVMDRLPGALSGTIGSIPKFTIHYICGRDLDHLGNASTWLFGVRYDNKSTLM